MDIDVRFVGKQDGKWLVEITVLLENKSQVRLKYEDFQITARYLLPGDKVEDGGHRIHHQLHFPRTIDERIGGEKRYFSNAEYINPKQVFGIVMSLLCRMRRRSCGCRQISSLI